MSSLGININLSAIVIPIDNYSPVGKECMSSKVVRFNQGIMYIFVGLKMSNFAEM